MSERATTVVLIAAMAVLLSLAPGYAATSGQAKEPDYTKGEELNVGGRKGNSTSHHNLGPIGVRAYIWSNSNGTQDTRMIQIKDAGEGSLLKNHDVILGVGDKKFSSDARKALAEAITNAEKKENKGKLVLMVWRPKGEVVVTRTPHKKPGRPVQVTKKWKYDEPLTGEVISVSMTLPVLGTYSAAAPWDCEKTQVIIDKACKAILDGGLKVKTNEKGAAIIGGYQIPQMLEVLGLLATGEEKYLPAVRDYVRKVADTHKKVGTGFHSWSYGYQTLLLTEYYLATKDEYVLPAINNIALTIARGASDVGTFSHSGAYSFKAHGRDWKYPSAYGAMNQCSITLTLGLVLAQKCGVKNDEVDDVVRKATGFYRWFADKGSIPYGDHRPGSHHDNNGANSQSAVLFDLLGDKETATYYTRSTLASYKIRENGHTGHFFSWHWGALGAARGGEAAAQSFVANTQWFLDLERRANGASSYQYKLGGSDHAKYEGWSTTGSRLMQHCLPRKQLYITGKGGSSVSPITGNELKECVAAANFDAKKLSTKELLKALGSWSPVVRQEASIELGKREDDVVDDMIAMLESGNRYQRYGAAEGLSYAGRGSEKAIDALIKRLQPDNDLTMRYYAANAFRKMRTWGRPGKKGGWSECKNGVAENREAIKKAVPALLKLAATYEPEKDPLRKLHVQVAETLFYGGKYDPYTGIFPNGKGIGGLDRKLLIPAIKSMLINPNGGGRSTASVIFSELTKSDLEQLWGDIYYATKYQAPSGSMFAHGVRASGLQVMAKNGVEEGIPVGIDWVLKQPGWGDHQRMDALPALLEYGSALEPYLPEIEKVLPTSPTVARLNNWKEGAVEGFKKKQLAPALKKPAPKMQSIKTYIDATPDPLLETLKK